MQDCSCFVERGVGHTIASHLISAHSKKLSLMRSESWTYKCQLHKKGAILQNKKVLIICTGNSCRSIIAQALINKYLGNVEAFSCGTAPTEEVNPNAKKVLTQNNCWDESYHSKHLDEVFHIKFDLVVTVCNQAKERCPLFPYPANIIHVGFQDPDKKEFDEFEKTYQDIKNTLLKKITTTLKEQKNSKEKQ